MILGCDPGITGGLALIRHDGSLVFAEAMPILHGTVTVVDPRQVDHLLRAAEGAEVTAVVERAQSFPGMGVSSSFNYGTAFGSLLGILGSLGIGIAFASPAKWKREMGLDSGKRRSVDLARQMYPKITLRASDDGIAEAVLLARWALRGVS